MYLFRLLFNHLKLKSYFTMASRNLPIVDWLQIESSAPGKFIISGEYSVAYEKQAIAAAIDLRTRVTIKPNKDGKVRLVLKSLDSTREWSTSSLTMFRFVTKYSECLDFIDTMPAKLTHLLHPRFNPNSSSSSTKSPASSSGQKQPEMKETDKKVDDAAIAFLLLYIGLGDSYCSSARPPIDVEVESDIPVGSGLGSSSAFSVALCGALMRVFRVAAEKYVISNWAFNIDKFFHGKPSGVDNNVVAHGSYILFQNGKIKACGVSHKVPVRVLLVDTCVSRSTKTLLDGVALRMSDDPQRILGIMNNINDITTSIWRRLNDPDFTPKNISTFLQANQERLDALGVGHEKINDIITKANQFDLTAKQTGAGGGGTAFVLYDLSDNCNGIKQLRNELETSGYRVSDHAIGCEGLVVKIIPDPDKQFSLNNDTK